MNTDQNGETGSRSISAVTVIEWRTSGHRLAHVRAVLTHALQQGSSVRLITTPRARTTVEYRTHLAEIEPALRVEEVDDLGGVIGVSRRLRRLRTTSDRVVLPEADRWLGLLLVLRLARSLPDGLTGIIMRPPRAGCGIRSTVIRATKTALLRLLMRLGGPPRLLLLEDPLATGDDRVWPAWAIDEGTLIHDPADIALPAVAALPEELGRLPEAAVVFALVGSINDRKQVDQIIAAWAHLGPGIHLVIAGLVQPGLRERLRGAVEMSHTNIHLIDRYLRDDELRGVVERSHGTFVLYDGGLSSGILLTAASCGRWVIALDGTRTGRVAIANHIGVLASRPEPSAIAQAVIAASERPTPTPLVLPGRREYAARLLDD